MLCIRKETKKPNNEYEHEYENGAENTGTELSLHQEEGAHWTVDNSKINIRVYKEL